MIPIRQRLFMMNTPAVDWLLPGHDRTPRFIGQEDSELEEVADDDADEDDEPVEGDDEDDDAEPDPEASFRWKKKKVLPCKRYLVTTNGLNQCRRSYDRLTRVPAQC